LTNIKRVEVIYGPASTLYGTNAFVGVINIITKEPEEMVKNKSIGINAAVGYGSYNSKFADLAFAYKKDIFSFSLTARIYESDRHDLSSQPFFDYNPSIYDAVNYKNLLNIKTGAQAYINANSLAASSPYYTIYGNGGNADSIILTDAGQTQARALDKSAYNQTVLGKKVGYANPANSYLINAKINVGSFSFGFQKMKRNEGAGTLFTDVAQDINNVYWIPERSYVYMKYERKLSNKLTFTSFSNYRNHSLNNDTRVPTVNNYSRKNLTIKDLAKDVVPFYNTTYYFLTNKQFRTEVKFLYTPSTNFYLITGVEYRSSQLQGNYLNSTNVFVPEETGVFAGIQAGGNQFDVNDIGAYVQGSYRFSKYWGITAGTRVDNNNIRQNGGYGTELSPRFVVDYIRKDWVVKAIYSRGIENVSNFTKFSISGTRIPNPNLGTESIKNFELSIAKKINKSLSVDIDFYQSIVEDVVGERKISTTVTQNQNVGRFNIFGIQSNLAYKKKALSVDLNYTYTDPKQTRDDNENVVDYRVGDISTHHVNGIVNYLFFNKLNVNFRTNFMSNRPTGVGTSVPANPESFPGYFISNTAIGLVNMIRHATLQLVCNNLFDKKYFHPGVRTADGLSTPSSILQPGRNFFVKLSYEF
ncbi:MAG: TonB-dependent receptor, partial [Pedobacter sp.]|nr:TonB-dependent receptor [Chitinophagaceae bacterium]